jgi:hypothetical protein
VVIDVVKQIAERVEDEPSALVFHELGNFGIGELDVDRGTHQLSPPGIVGGPHVCFC